MKLGNLAARMATAAIAAPVLILAIQWRRHEGWWAIVLFAIVLALIEFFTMMLDDKVERWFSIGLGVLVAVGLYGWPASWIAFGPVVVVVAALFYLFRLRDIETTMTRLGTTVFGVVYTAVLLTFVASIKRAGGWNGGGWVFLILLTAWFGDTAAYFAGRFLGRAKLYPAVSPKKTWVGAVGGLLGSFGAAALANLWFFPALGWGHGAILTLVGGALGQAGDLVESLLKRSRKIKDSGNLLPGHGGILDRIDAVLFIAPWVYLYAFLVWKTA